MKDNKGSRPKRGFMVINLIETPSGYSIIEGTQLLNKTHNQTPANNHPPPSAPPSFQPLPVIKQQPKMTTKQNNLFFLKSPSDFGFSLRQENSKNQQRKVPQQTKSFAQWFNFNEVSQYEANQIKFWLTGGVPQKMSDSNSTFEAILQKYKKHRNIIIQIYYANFASSRSYMSASTVRKYICQDAQWLMKIHVFLTNWGIINSTKINFQNQYLSISNLLKLSSSGQYGVLNLQSSYYSNCKKRLVRQSEAENYSALKKATQNVRPYCDYCGIHCEIVWFQHIRIMDPKEISTIMKNVNSKNPPLSQKQYEIILCTKCYCNGNFPLLLTHHDFRKVSVNDRLEPGKKKKTSKSKRKQKKRKMKEKQLMEEEEDYKQQIDEGQQEANKIKEKKEEKEKEKQKEEQQNENEQQKDELASKQKKNNSVPTLNGNIKQKQVKVIGIQNGMASEPQKQVNITQVINQIVSSIKKQRAWSFQQTKKLLQLIDKHGDDWDCIHKNMIKAGYCYDCDPQDLILYFIKMPQMNIGELIQQNSNECFVNQNKSEYKSEFLTKKIQRNFDNSVKISSRLLKNERTVKEQCNQKWKQLLNKFVSLHIHKINNKIELLTELNAKSLSEQRKYEQATKQISEQ